MESILLVPLGMGLIVIGAAYGIGRFTAAAAEVLQGNQKHLIKLQVQ